MLKALFVSTFIGVGALVIYKNKLNTISKKADPNLHGQFAAENLDDSATEKMIQPPIFWKPHASLHSSEPTPYTTLTFSPDSKFLIACNKNGSIEIWNIEKRTIHNTLKLPMHGTKIAFSPDSTQFAVCSRHNSISLWSWPNQQKLHTLEGHTKKTCDNYYCDEKNCCCSIGWLSYTKNGTELISASSKDGLVNFWDPQSGKLNRTVHIKTNDPYGQEALALSPDGSCIALISDHEDQDNDLESSDAGCIASAANDSWDPDCLEELRSMYPDFDPESPELSMISESNRYLFPNYGQDEENFISFINIFDCATGKKIKKISININGYEWMKAYANWCPCAICFSPSGTSLAVGCSKAIVRLIHTQDWKETRHVDLFAHYGKGTFINQYNLQFSPQEDQLAAIVDQSDLFEEDPTLTPVPTLALIWDLQSGKIIQKFDQANQLAFSPNGDLFAVCTLAQPESSNHIKLFRRL